MSPADPENDAEVIIVGAGISGIAVAIELLRRGVRKIILLERADRVGGTWRDNTYPGVAVDIPASSYCFEFESDYPWTRAFPSGAEIQAYIVHCARKYEVERLVRYGCTVERTDFDEDAGRWVVTTREGPQLRSRFLVAATGLFTTPIVPPLPGLAQFGGTSFHSAHWDHAHDLTGRRVAVIGTGASAVQLIPEIADRVAQLHVFQRTPIWIAPRFDMALAAPTRVFRLRRWSAVRRFMRSISEAGIELLTFAATDHHRVPWLVKTVQWLVRQWMRSQVRDRATRERLLPDYALGCKRPTSSNQYLRTFNRDHVHLVTREISAIEAAGIRTRDGEVHPVDTIVLATGFLTTQRGNAPAFAVHGRDGLELGDFWRDQRLQSYRGVAVPGYPNFFLTAGPYSGGFNWFRMLEAHVPQIVGCIERALRSGGRVEVDAQAHAGWMRDMWKGAEGTIFKHADCTGARSYYIDERGDAALPSPRTPWWRSRAVRDAETRGFRFTER